MKKMKILILGGDKRMAYVAQILREKEHLVNAYKVADIKDEVGSEILKTKYDLIIGPIPLTRDGNHLNVELAGVEVKLSELFRQMEGTRFIGCKIPENIKNILNQKRIAWDDILERNDFAIDNALPTAEGAIQVAMEQTPYVLTSSKCLVLGFGRCGRVLADKLKGIGAHVTVEARKPQDLAYIRAYGYEDLHLRDLNGSLIKYDIVFNTIPALILNKERLAKMRKDTLIIDLASKPGGTDFLEASAIGITAILSLGLPGKCAPRTASLIIIRCIENILNERE